MTMRTIRHIMIAVTAAAGLISCANEDKKLTIADQEAAIDSYITQNYANNTVVRKNGSNRVILDSTSVNIPDSLMYGDSLYFLLCRIYFHKFSVKTVQHEQLYCSRRVRVCNIPIRTTQYGKYYILTAVWSMD